MIHDEAGNWIAPWIETWGDRLVRYAYVMTGDYHLAQDLAQEAVLKLHTFYHQHPEREFSPGCGGFPSRTCVAAVLYPWRCPHRWGEGIERCGCRPSFMTCCSSCQSRTVNACGYSITRIGPPTGLPAILAIRRVQFLTGNIGVFDVEFGRSRIVLCDP